jgi:hypothetical protein
MGIRRLISRLNLLGIAINESRLRWKWRTGQLPKPKIEAGRYAFNECDVAMIAARLDFGALAGVGTTEEGRDDAGDDHHQLAGGAR